MVAAMVEAESAWAIAIGDAIRRSLGPRPQRWLATETRLDPSTVSKIINGQQPPSLDQVDAIAKALHMTRRALLSLAGYVEPTQGLDLDTLPPWARYSLEAILERVNRERPPEVPPLDGEAVLGNDGHGL
jgi:transcriptional regulator with XRE-family HTH domain